MKDLHLAIELAKRDLRSCYRENGIITGSRGVYWSWDSFFASLGALEIGDYKVVKKNLELYLKFQNKKGNIPKRIANPFYIFRYIGLPIKESPEKQKPNYSSPYYTGESISQGPIFIICFYEYILKTKDYKFLKQNISKIEKLIKFLKTHTYKSGLLKESFGGGWAESVLKHGAITFTNVCYVDSLRAVSKLYSKLKNIRKAEFYQSSYLEMKTVINDKLWNESDGGFYSDWLGVFRHHHFVSDGNLLAVLFGLAEKNQIKSIDKNIDELIDSTSVPLSLTLHKYYLWRIHFANMISGMKNYHISFSWLWLGSLAAIYKAQIGQSRIAKSLLNDVASRIVSDRFVYEIYFNKKPVDLFLYSSEKPWAWSAGMFLYACSKLGHSLK